MKRRLVSMALILVMVLSAVSAGPNLRWSWENTDSKATYFRYQLDGGAVVDTSEKCLLTEDDGKSHTLSIWQSYDGKLWSKPATVVYAPEASSTGRKSSGKADIAILVSPYSFQDIVFVEDFFNIWSNYGFGVELDGTYHLSESLRIGAEAGFSSYWLCDKATFNRLSEASFGGNFGCQKVFDKTVVYAEASIGAALNMTEGYSTTYGYLGAKVGAEFEVGENLSTMVQLATKTLFHAKHNSSFPIIATPSVGVAYTF